jgi:hypothetical protein
MHFKKFVVSFGLAGSLALAPTAALAADPSTHDIAFLKAAHQTNLAVILGGQVAWKKTTDPAVKKLAATLMRDHIHLDAALAAHRTHRRTAGDHRTVRGGSAQRDRRPLHQHAANTHPRSRSTGINSSREGLGPGGQERRREGFSDSLRSPRAAPQGCEFGTDCRLTRCIPPVGGYLTLACLHERRPPRMSLLLWGFGRCRAAGRLWFRLGGWPGRPFCGTPGHPSGPSGGEAGDSDAESA